MGCQGRGPGRGQRLREPARGRETDESLPFLRLGFSFASPAGDARSACLQAEVGRLQPSFWWEGAGVGGGAYQKLGGDLEAVELKGEGGGGEASFWELEFPFVLGRKDLCIQCVCVYVRVRV